MRWLLITLCLFQIHCLAQDKQPTISLVGDSVPHHIISACIGFPIFTTDAPWNQNGGLLISTSIAVSYEAILGRVPLGFRVMPIYIYEFPDVFNFGHLRDRYGQVGGAFSPRYYLKSKAENQSFLGVEGAVTTHIQSLGRRAPTDEYKTMDYTVSLVSGGHFIYRGNWDVIAESGIGYRQFTEWRVDAADPLSPTQSVPSQVSMLHFFARIGIGKRFRQAPK
jgi:hypothetical protein